MELNLPLEKMSIEDKIQAMEILWEDLSKKAESISSPYWHKEILEEREKAVKDGTEKFIDWNTAKKQINDEIS